MALGWAFSLFLSLCLLCLLISIAWKRTSKGGKLPPGPTPIPVLGNLLQVRIDNIFQSFLKVSKKYGPVFTVYFGPRPVVILCGHEAMKEALVDQADDFSGRGEMPTIDKNFQGHGLALSNGERWKVLRRFSLTVLRNFGMGKRSIEERIQEEAGYLLEEFHKVKGAPIDPTFYLSRTVSNVICSVVFGKRFDYEDKCFQSLMKMINESFVEMSKPWAQLYDMFWRIMQYFPGSHNYLYDLIEELKDFIASRIKINEASFDPSNPRDYIDCFLIKMHQDKSDPNTEFNLKNLVLTTLNLFFAGTETVSSTLRYGFLLLTKYPEVEAKVYEEIKQVIGTHRIPTVDDRAKMPYTDAVIHEIQRITDIVPLGVPHNVIRDTHFRGYFLPKGTDVYPLIGSVLKDPKYFRYPDAFYPQHFLDEQGRFKKNDAFVVFSSGKRICIGEALARMELFLYFTSILQRFSLRSLVPPADINITHRISGFGNIPPTYKLCFMAR
ncbi:cytochrome P450 2G1 isoform X1 [Peromyscus californicus insignis]|uniref:cytochrome P450 2G1 isoform X1 n=1 Tax=Peromyscus californicus insignis TaxID=564181 RepID=UPI0022A6C187|nr:cytochrome P450 2G1 isoform X1 [Peromyscus californicus insignis]